jgi:hypothetical protein
VRRSRQHPFEVVQNEQHVLGGENVRERVKVGLPEPLAYPECTGNGGNNEVGIRQRGKIDEDHAIVERTPEVCGALEGEAGLAGPSCPCNRHQADIAGLQEGDKRSEFALPPQERSEGPWEQGVVTCSGVLRLGHTPGTRRGKEGLPVGCAKFKGIGEEAHGGKMWRPAHPTF